MRTSRRALVLALAVCASSAWGAPAKREPRVGYLFPGGGRQGTTFDVIIGGQFLARATNVYVSGGGVRASVVKHYRPPRVVYGEQREKLVKQLVDLREKRRAELPKGARIPPYPGEYRLRAGRKKGREDAKKKDGKEAEPVELPDHPLLRDLSSRDIRGLQEVANAFLDYTAFRKKQPNAQISEMALLRVTIDPGAPPGYREVRLATPLGITNPIAFHVGTLPEAREREPNDPGQFAYLPKDAPLKPPVVLNGQIMPGDVDRFRFEAKRGQRLVIETHARRLMPFLADAVPGWFQATVALYDAQGREVAFADDYQFHPDPVLLFEPPEDGVYELEVRDAIYRGREDFVYRVSVGELPFITRMFPLGGPMGVKTVASVDGWNLPANRLELDTGYRNDPVRQTALRADGLTSNEVTYAVNTLPEATETEPNDDARRAQQVALPKILNGRIGRPGDVDVFRFEGREGDEVVAAVLGRRLQSPLDSVLRLTDASGRVLTWNDDTTQKDAGHLHPDMGVLTHHADSHVRTHLPKDGTYYVRLADAQDHGGEAYAYRLRISAPQPDFELRMAPSSVNMRAGETVPLAVYALRRDGFQGSIDVSLKSAPQGFVLTGGRIPVGRDSVRVTLTAPRKARQKPVTLRLQGQAQIGGKPVVRPVVPSEDMMQAFLYRHLAPSQQLMVAVTKGWGRGSEIALAGGGPVRIPPGGSGRVLFKGIRQPGDRKIDLELRDPAPGMTIEDVKFGPEGLVFHLKVEGEAVKAGFADNAIIEAFTEYTVRPKGKDGGKGPAQKRRVSLGVLPAVPFVIAQR